MSDEPMSELLLASVGMHEMFKTFVEGGFTEDQALTIVARWLAAMKQPDQ